MNLGMIHDDSMYSMYSVFSKCCNTCLEWENVENIGKLTTAKKSQCHASTGARFQPRDPEDFASCQDMNNLCLCRGCGANSHPGSMKGSIQRHAKSTLADIIRDAVQMEVRDKGGPGTPWQTAQFDNHSTWSGF